MSVNMMSSVHDCVKIGLENEYFKEKLTEFYKENKKLKDEIGKLLVENRLLRTTTAQNRCQSLDKSTSPIRSDQKTSNQSVLQKNLLLFSSSRCSICSKTTNTKISSSFSKNKLTQTEPMGKVSTGVNTFDKDMFNRQNKKSYDKLCQMQHDLLKKYEDEVNMGAVKQGLINQLKLELEKSENVCKSYENELIDLRSQLEELEALKKQNRSLKIDLEGIKLKYETCQKELDFFDEDFFDEIKTLKCKYRDALKLNKYYENLLFHSESGKKPRSKAKTECFDLNDLDLNEFSNLLVNELNCD